MKKIIAWEKWRDNENYVEASEGLNSEINMSQQIDMGEMDEDDEDGEIMPPNVDVTIYPHIVRTPIGDFSVLDHNLPSKNFDCWIGHFNFPITESVFWTLDNKVNGIEVLRVLSKYRIFIGVGRLFRFRDVREQINKLFYAESLSNKNPVENEEE